MEALGEIGGRMALPLLREALKDGNEDIRLAAADLIDEIENDDDEVQSDRSRRMREEDGILGHVWMFGMVPFFRQ